METGMRGAHPAREFEIKLEIPAQTVSKVMRLPWLWELASGELRPQRLQSIYYDTPNFTLLERGVTLRVRRAGATRVQTIKAAVNGAALPIERDEWEEEITGEEPELHFTGTPLEGMAKKKLRRKLKPCFEIHVDRSAFPIQSANSAIEIAIDRAHIVGEQSASFCEIELELKRGASSEMARIARRIASEVPAALSLKTKAERGFALLRNQPAQPHFGEAASLTPSTRVGDAFQSIGWACLRHFALNKDAIETGAAEAVHQMRAGLMRLDAAIAIFGRLLDGPETDAVKAEINWLISELDSACALDAFLEGVLAPLRATQNDTAAIDALTDETVERRQRALAHVIEIVTSERYRQFVLRAALWLIAAEWADKGALKYDEPSRRIGAFARRALTTSARDAASRLRNFSAGEASDLPALRSALHRLRCAADWFAPLFATERTAARRYVRVLDRLLADTGRLADFATHERLRDDFMRSWTDADAPADPKTAQKAFAMGFALGQQTPEKTARSEAVVKAGAKLAALGRFWR
jgi:inorganic triphosphatase YgiF